MNDTAHIGRVLVESAATFVGCLLLHVGWWRLRRPRTFHQWLPALVVIFLVVGPVAAWGFTAGGDGTNGVTGARLTHWFAILLPHVTASGLYIIGYTLVSAFSPSIELLKLLEATPGLRREDIDLPYLRTAVGGERVTNLLGEGMIRVDDGHVALGPRSRTLTALVLWYRHAIGLPDGSGG